jgi:hypothetical protein
MTPNSETLSVLVLKLLDETNHLRAENQAIKEGLILLLKAQTKFPEGMTPADFLAQIELTYLAKTQPKIEEAKKILGS